MFCDSTDRSPENIGYTYHELFTCQPCLDRVGLPAMDEIAEQIGKRSGRNMRLQSEAKPRSTA